MPNLLMVFDYSTPLIVSYTAHIIEFHGFLLVLIHVPQASRAPGNVHAGLVLVDLMPWIRNRLLAYGRSKQPGDRGALALQLIIHEISNQSLTTSSIQYWVNIPRLWTSTLGYPRVTCHTISTGY